MARASVAKRLRSARPNSSCAPPPDLRAIDREVFYVERETAHFARLKNPKTLANWRSLGLHPELRWTKEGGRVLYKGADIIAFLEGTAKAPEPAKPRTRRGSR